MLLVFLENADEALEVRNGNWIYTYLYQISETKTGENHSL